MACALPCTNTAEAVEQAGENGGLAIVAELAQTVPLFFWYW